MKNYKQCRSAFLWLFLMVGFFVCVPSQVWAGPIETTTFANPLENDALGEDDLKCTLEEVGKDYKSKWWKPPLTTLMEASSAVGKGMFNSAAGGMQRLVVVGAGLWLVTFMMKVIGGMVESDPMENLTKVGGMMLRVGFAWIFLQYSFFEEYIFESLMGIVTGLSGGGGGGAGDLITIADQIHSDISDLRSKAAVLRCVKPHKLTLVGIDFPLLDLGDYGGGVIVGCVGLLFNIAFPFFLFDAVFRMGVVIAVSPLFVGAWVFDVTRPYAKKGANAVMNVGFVFLMVGIAAKVAVKLIAQVTGLDGTMPHDACLFRMFDFSDGTASCSEGVSFSVVFILGICACYGLLIMHEGSNKLANYFSETDFSNDTAFQAAKGGTVGAVNMANNATNLGVETAKTGAQVARGTVQAAGAVGGAVGAVGRGIGKGIGKIGGGLKSLGSRLSGKKSGGSSGGSSSFNSNGKSRLNAVTPPLPKGVPAGSTYNAKNQTWTSNKTNKDGSSTSTVMDKNGARQSETKKDSNGNITSHTDFQNGNPVRTQTASYNDKGQKTSETISEGGKSSTRNFDENGRLSSQTERKADGTTTKSEWKRDANGKVTGSSVETKQRDGSKTTTVFDHDANGKRTGGLQTTTDASGKEKTLFVDENGQRPQGISDNAQYDSKTQSWSTNYTDKKTGQTTRTVMNKEGKVQNMVKTNADGTVFSDTKYGANGNPITSKGSHIS